MLNAVYNFVLLLKQSQIMQTKIVLTQGDNRSNVFHVRIIDNEKDIDYSQASAKIAFVKADGTVVQGDMTTSPNGYTYQLLANEIAAVGEVVCSVMLYGANGERLSISRFVFTVQEDAMPSSVVESSTEMDALMQAVQLLHRLENEVYSGFYVHLAGGVLNIIARYNAAKDIRYVFMRKGPNELFDLDRIFLIDAGEELSSDITAGAKFWENSSDCFSPYSVRTIADGGGTTDWIFTGGNHGYNGDATGAPTARCASLNFAVNGRPVTEYEGFCWSLQVWWTNAIKAMNTVREDGTGRDVLIERYSLSFDGTQFDVTNEIELQEESTIYSYYGLCLITSNWDLSAWKDKILYRSSLNGAWLDMVTGSNSGDRKCTAIVMSRDGHSAELGISPIEGVGDGRYLTDAGTTWNAHLSTDASKAYFDLIAGYVTLPAGAVLNYRGHLKISYREN